MIQTGQPTVQYNDFKLSLLRKSGKKISWNGTNYKTAVCKLQYIGVLEYSSETAEIYADYLLQ